MMLRRRCSGPTGKTSGMTSAIARANQPTRVFLIHIRGGILVLLWWTAKFAAEILHLLLFIRNIEHNTVAFF